MFGRFIRKESTGDEFLEQVQDFQAKYGTTNGQPHHYAKGHVVKN